MALAKGTSGMNRVERNWGSVAEPLPDVHPGDATKGGVKKATCGIGYGHSCGRVIRRTTWKYGKHPNRRF